MFSEVVRRDLFVEVTLEQKPEGTEGARHADGGWGGLSGERAQPVQRSWDRVYLAGLRNRRGQEVSK